MNLSVSGTTRISWSIGQSESYSATRSNEFRANRSPTEQQANAAFHRSVVLNPSGSVIYNCGALPHSIFNANDMVSIPSPSEIMISISPVNAGESCEAFVDIGTGHFTANLDAGGILHVANYETDLQLLDDTISINHETGGDILVEITVIGVGVYSP